MEYEMNKDHFPNSNVMIVGAKPNNRLAFRKMMVDLGCDNRKIDVKITIQEAMSSFECQRNIILVIDDDCKDLDDINLLINKLNDGDSKNMQFLITFMTSDITSDLVREIKRNRFSIVIQKPYTMGSFNESFNEFFYNINEIETQQLKENKKKKKRLKRIKESYVEFNHFINCIIQNEFSVDDQFVDLSKKFLNSLDTKVDFDSLGKILSLGISSKRYSDLDLFVEGWINSFPVKSGYITDISKVLIYNQRFELLDKLNSEDERARISIGVGMVLAGSVLISNDNEKDLAIGFIKKGITLTDSKTLVINKAFEILLKSNEIEEAKEIYNDLNLKNKTELKEEFKDFFEVHV
jgi:hypothetical protein